MERKYSSSQQEKDYKIYVIGDELKQNKELIKAIKHFGFPVTYCSDGGKLESTTGESKPICILGEFSGELFTNLLKAGHRILGPTIVIQCAKKNEDLPRRSRPLYCTAMKNLTLTFAGFRNSKEEMDQLSNLVRYMSGSVRKEFKMTETTHLVATKNALFGEKYKYSANVGIPIMTQEWIYQTWAQRHNIHCTATDQILMQQKLLPFLGLRMSFLEYQLEEKQHMEQISIKNGGEVVDSNDPLCSHVIVEDGAIVHASRFGPKVKVLKNEWFWACLQLEARADESMYIYQNQNTTFNSSSIVWPETGNKREKLESIAHQLALESLEYDLYNTQDFSKTDSAISVSEDVTFNINSTDSTDSNKQVKSPTLDLRLLTPRQQICEELIQTERNYVGILHTILAVFKEPLENRNLMTGQLLSSTEVKLIFGYLTPIYEVHMKMLEDLEEISQSHKEHGVGNIILKHAFDLLKSYPPFINFFEKSKEILEACDASNPRFHAFLKVCQSKAECGRQTLQELLIRPVQRLPSIILLLTDLLKHTSTNTIEYQVTEKSIQTLKDVLKHMNEDKRKTENHIAMFDTYNNIDSCPPNLLSSHRTLVSEIEVQELTELLNQKGNTLTMYLFSDALEICKRKKKSDCKTSKRNLSNTGSSTPKAAHKAYKHIELIYLSYLRRVVDISETEDCRNSFGVVFWSNSELKELLYAFRLLEDVPKSTFLHLLCRQIALSRCKAEATSLITILEPQHLNLEPENESGIRKVLKRSQSKSGSSWSLKSNSSSKFSLTGAFSNFLDPFKALAGPSKKTPTRVSSFSELDFEPSTPFQAAPGIQKRKSSSLVDAFEMNI